MSQSDATPYVEKILPDLVNCLLCEDPTIAALLLPTDTKTWILEDCNAAQACFLGHGRIKFGVELILQAQPSPDQSGPVPTIHTTVDGEIQHDGHHWLVSSYDVVQATRAEI